MTLAKLEDMGFLCMISRKYTLTHAFNLMIDNNIRHAKLQCRTIQMPGLG